MEGECATEGQWPSFGDGGRDGSGAKYRPAAHGTVSKRGSTITPVLPPKTGRKNSGFLFFFFFLSFFLFFFYFSFAYFLFFYTCFFPSLPLSLPQLSLGPQHPKILFQFAIFFSLQSSSILTLSPQSNYLSPTTLNTAPFYEYRPQQLSRTHSRKQRRFPSIPIPPPTSPIPPPLLPYQNHPTRRHLLFSFPPSSPPSPPQNQNPRPPNP